MSSTRSCRFCGSEELERSEHKGELTCCRCGAVLEESGIVEGLQFTEAAGGGMSLGQCAVSRTGTKLLLHLLQHLLLQLFFGGYLCLTTAKAAVTVLPAAAAASAAAESAAAAVAGFTVVFMKLLRVLHVQVPHVDPSLFLERFAAQLQLGDKTQQVAQTAVRLVQAMKRDWIATGRRPMGLCGAALLIAARYHDVQIEAEDVAVVSVAQLPAAALAETDLLQLPALSLPPCRLTKRRQQQQQQQQIQDALPFVSFCLLLSPFVSFCCHTPRVFASLPTVSLIVFVSWSGGCLLCAAAATADAGEDAAAAGAAAGASPAAAAAAEGAAIAAGGEETQGPNKEKETERRQLSLSAGSDALCNERPSSGDILSVAGWIVQTISSSAPPEEAAAAAAAATAAAAADGAAAGGAAAADPTDKAAAAARSQSAKGDTRDGDSAASGDTRAGLETAAATAAAAEGEHEETVRLTESENPLADLLRSVRARADELLPPAETQGLAAAADSGESPCAAAAAAGSAAGAGAARPAAAAAAAAAAEGQRGAAEGEEDDEESDGALEDMLLNEEEREAKALIWDDLTRDIMPEVNRRMRQRKQNEREQQQNPNKRCLSFAAVLCLFVSFLHCLL
ncbi:transcription factor IIIb subunit, putative [Eimeria acervulina]|uniref:Transcription factor IIIb subunit, putative n=1 Tax=Eimeria acervulina TaxID=5801 RepID=U6GV50_EIMAC|nr:transcription factor IIIb subunit, putative [Eimeria acervulina]CDI84035.1 transcription factor IIIb subunit, putative [Eimeria acervulina]